MYVEGSNPSPFALQEALPEVVIVAGQVVGELTVFTMLEYSTPPQLTPDEVNKVKPVPADNEADGDEYDTAAAIAENVQYPLTPEPQLRLVVAYPES
jgi:hypothetical protein